jgi:hypothetical protein
MTETTTHTPPYWAAPIRSDARFAAAAAARAAAVDVLRWWDAALSTDGLGLMDHDGTEDALVALFDWVMDVEPREDAIVALPSRVGFFSTVSGRARVVWHGGVEEARLAHAAFGSGGHAGVSRRLRRRSRLRTQ